MNSASNTNQSTPGFSRSSSPAPFGNGGLQRDGLSSNGGTPEAVAHSEGKVARAIEEQTAKLPSDVFLWAAVGSMGVSLAMHMAGKKENAVFVGQWAAPFLLLGVYNKLVKLGGSDRIHS